MALRRFARRLRADLGATKVLLYGAHSRSNADVDRDYNLIIVSPSFDRIAEVERSVGLRDLYYEEGGDAPLDLICLTPDEFEAARHGISLVSAVLPDAVDLLEMADSQETAIS
jgi:predicted nucleotidyltransferase